MNFHLKSIVLAVIAFFCLYIIFDLKLWNEEHRVIEHDVRIYYGYLPSTLIFKDVALEKKEYTDGNNALFWTNETPDGHKIFKMTCGLSFLYLPFFIPAHYSAIQMGYMPNGFSAPYKLFLILSSVFFLIVGLGFTFRILEHLQFKPIVNIITILLLGLATNLLCYSSQSAGMAHVYNFALIAAFVYFGMRYHENPNIKYAVLLGLLFGLITLIRPSNGLVLIFLLLHNVRNITDLFRIRFNFYLILLFISCALLVWIPQFTYWKYTTGNLFVYAYNDERFFFLEPKIYKGLFSFRKGWLVYTPVMIFSVAGLFLLRNQLKRTRFAVLIFTILNVYIIFSWWCWWYGGSFGQRALIDSYAIMAIPLAAFLSFIYSQRQLIRIFFTVVLLFLTWLNVFQTYQFEYHSLHWDGMNRDLYLKQFGKLNKIENHESLVSWPNYDDAKKGIR